MCYWRSVLLQSSRLHRKIPFALYRYMPRVYSIQNFQWLHGSRGVMFHLGAPGQWLRHTIWHRDVTTLGDVISLPGSLLRVELCVPCASFSDSWEPDRSSCSTHGMRTLCLLPILHLILSLKWDFSILYISVCNWDLSVLSSHSWLHEQGYLRVHMKLNSYKHFTFCEWGWQRGLLLPLPEHIHWELLYSWRVYEWSARRSWL